MVKKKDKAPKAPQKKLTKKEKERLAAELAEQQKIEQEKERQRQIQEEKERAERERLAAEEKARRDIQEQGVRESELKETIKLFERHQNKTYKVRLQKRDQEEWEQYLKCDGLPDPCSLSEMNTYLFLWTSIKERGVVDDVLKRTKEVLGLLGALQELIDNPLAVSEQHVEDWKEVRNNFRKEQQIDLNRVAYLMLREIEKKMTLTGLNIVNYSSKFDKFILCLWSLTKLPTRMLPLTKAERVPLFCEFADVGVSVSLPDSLFDVLLVVRAMLVNYDHLSDLCPSYNAKPLFEDFQKDLYETSLVEWEARQELQKVVDEETDRRTQLAAKIAGGKPPGSEEGKRKKDKGPQQTPEQQEAYMLELQELQQVPVKTTSQMYTEQEDEMQTEVKAQFLMDVEPHELNLRKYVVLGGVFHIDLLQQPPQPQELHGGTIITTLQVPTELLPVDFHEKYEPPAPPEPGQRRSPEEIEAELRKQEEELEKLALANIEAESKKGKGKKGKGKGKGKGKKGAKEENVEGEPVIEAAVEPIQPALPVESEEGKGKKRKGKEGKEKKGGKKKKELTAEELEMAAYAVPSALLAAVGSRKSKLVIEEEEPTGPDPELERLGLVEIKLPGNVLWFEPPIVAGWDNEKGYWVTEDYHDLKFNEDKQILTFRTGRFGAIGLAAYRYANLPYQTWELKPNPKGEGVSFSITAAVMIVEFIIQDDKVCLNQLQNGATKALQEIVGNFYTPYQLRRLMINGGVDLFPEYDAYCYIDGATPKHRATEDHLYHCMAILSTSHTFSWSRWNLLAGRRNIVLQIRELVEKKKADYSVLLVTPLKTCLVDCTEMSQSFSDEAIEGSRFCSDLYHLLLDQGGRLTKAKVHEIPFLLAETVFEMLVTTRVLSYS